MRLMVIFAVLLTGVSTGSQAMPAGEFLTKAEALSSRGPFALLSSDYSVLKDATMAAGMALKKERLAAVAVHQRPAYCPPAGKGGMDADELMNAIRAMPPALRAKTDLKDALRSMLMHKYPCPA